MLVQAKLLYVTLQRSAYRMLCRYADSLRCMKEILLNSRPSLVNMTCRNVWSLSVTLGLVMGFASEALAQGRYSYSADGSEVVDSTTGLTWLRCSAGQSWSGSTCTGTASTYTHEAALTFAQAQTGWRLPNVKELSSLVTRSPNSVAVDSVAFPATPSFYYWSSTPYISSPASAWVVELGSNRFVHPVDRAFPCNVRLVR